MPSLGILPTASQPRLIQPCALADEMHADYSVAYAHTRMCGRAPRAVEDGPQWDDLGSKKCRFWKVLRVTEGSAASDDVNRPAAEGGRRCSGGRGRQAKATGNHAGFTQKVKIFFALRAEGWPAAEGGRRRGYMAAEGWRPG